MNYGSKTRLREEYLDSRRQKRQEHEQNPIMWGFIISALHYTYKLIITSERYYLMGCDASIFTAEKQAKQAINPKQTTRWDRSTQFAFASMAYSSTLKIEAVCSTETFNIYRTIRHRIPVSAERPSDLTLPGLSEWVLDGWRMHPFTLFGSIVYLKTLSVAQTV
jgi:hypothetical protein